MAGWSFQEVFLLMVIGLIVLGPKRLPQVANQLGTWLGQARRMTRMMKRQLEDEINFDVNSINVQKSLGLEDEPAGEKPASVSAPSYVHESKAGTAADADAGTPGAAVEKEELPDDFSPAHAPDEVGTGVADEADDGGDDIEPVRTAETGSVEESAAEPADDKKETA